MAVDLHTHSNCSDGSMTPEELIRHATAAELTAIALTDHDTIAGCSAAQKAAESTGLTVVNGVELSIDYPLPGKAHVHVLGLFINPAHQGLAAELDRLKEARTERAYSILDRLKKIGMPISNDELSEVVGNSSPGRPHIVSLLLKKKYVYNAFFAYTAILGKGGKAYVPKTKLPLEPAIDLIHRAGGVAILAHPVSLMFANYPLLGDEILKFQALGLDGIEVFYSSQDHYFSRWLYDFCQKHNLLISGGSDFHGRTKPDVKIGTGRGNLRIPDRIFNILQQAAANKRSSTV